MKEIYSQLRVMGKKKFRLKSSGGKGIPLGALKGATKIARGASKLIGKDNSNQSPSGSSAASADSGAASESISQEIAKENYIQLANANSKNNFFGKILTVIKNILNFFFSRDYPIAHYITLALVIIILIVGFNFGSSRKKKKKSWWSKLLGYRISGYFATPVMEPRKKNIGRCDNINFIEHRVGKNGVCVNAKMPEPIKWLINPDTIPELKDIPISIQNEISNNGAKYTVTIPWKADGLVYVPDCEAAVFADGSNAYLLQDNGGFCSKIELQKIIETGKYRYIPEYTEGYRGFDSFLTDPSNISSSLIEDVSPGEVCSIKAAKDLGIYDPKTFYIPEYDTIRTYNKDIDTTKFFTHKLCTESTTKKEATILCPLIKTAGIGFTNKPGSTCITSECPTGFTEDTENPMICKKPIKERLVQLKTRNDEQYDDWYTIPNYHLGNKFDRIGSNNYSPCPGNTIPYYATDPVDNTMGDTDMKDQTDQCVDKNLYFGGKYADTNNFCPISLIKRVGSSKNELMEYYIRISNNENIPAVEKQKILNIVNNIKTENFNNLNLLTDEMEAACNKLNIDESKLEEAYNICEQLSKNEEGFISKFTNEPSSQVKLRANVCKYSCQQLFGISPENRSNPQAFNENASRINKSPLNFPDAEKIQFEEYITEYEKEVRKKTTPLPVISAEPAKKNFVSVFTRAHIIKYVAIGSIILLILLTLYVKRRYLYLWFCSYIRTPIYKVLSFIFVNHDLNKTAGPCKSSKTIREEELAEKSKEKQVNGEISSDTPPPTQTDTPQAEKPDAEKRVQKNQMQKKRVQKNRVQKNRMQKNRVQ